MCQMSATQALFADRIRQIIALNRPALLAVELETVRTMHGDDGLCSLLQGSLSAYDLINPLREDDGQLRRALRDTPVLAKLRRMGVVGR